MLPVARSTGAELRGGFWDYIRRRGRRILPPYYAALLLSLLVDGLPPLHHGRGTIWDPDSGVSLKAIVTHLFLVHNLTRSDALKINGPLWSVATEWQIYFLFPLLLLPIWRRFGAFPSVLIGLVVGIAPHFLFHGRFDPAMPEMIALFALGMAAAGVSFSARAQERRWRDAVPWGTLTAVGAVLVVSLSLRGPDWVVAHFVLVNPIVGAAAACLLVYCTGQTSKARTAPTPLLQVLDSRPAVVLGTFSYSLYLIHWPLLLLVQGPLVRSHVSALGSLLIFPGRAAGDCGLGVPVPSRLRAPVHEPPRAKDGAPGGGRRHHQPCAIAPSYDANPLVGTERGLLHSTENGGDLENVMKSDMPQKNSEGRTIVRDWLFGAEDLWPICLAFRHNGCSSMVATRKRWRHPGGFDRHDCVGVLAGEGVACERSPDPDGRP